MIGVLFAVLPSGVYAQTTPLLLYGGSNQDVFLGCLNCNRYASDSVCNRYGTFGSRYSAESIWNRYGVYGSRYSGTSPWNRYASNPPVIVDRDGNFYRYFTASRSRPNRTRNQFFLAFLDNPNEVNSDLQQARDLFCDP